MTDWINDNVEMISHIGVAVSAFIGIASVILATTKTKETAYIKRWEFLLGLVTMNVMKAANNDHYSWQACDTPIECGPDCPGSAVLDVPEVIERPNRRAAIEATKRKRAARALVG